MNNQIIQNKPNFRKAKMVVTAVYTMANNNEQRTVNYSKQTQSNPILSASGGFKRYAYCSDLLLSLERKVRMSESQFKRGVIYPVSKGYARVA